jgi:adenylate cyclase
MRISISYLTSQKSFDTAKRDFVFGRSEGTSSIGLDLVPDGKVSRRHGRIWLEDDKWWIEDLNSSRGTRLNGKEIKGAGKQRLRTADVIEVGETALRINSLEPGSQIALTSFLAAGTVMISADDVAHSEIVVAKYVDATEVSPPPLQGDSEETARRFKMICDLPLQFSSKTKLELILPAVVDGLCDLIPKAQSWSLVLQEPGSDTLLLKAYSAEREPRLSETLARRAMKEHKAFIWKKSTEVDMSKSIMQNALEEGMYAPLLWQDEPLGVICGGTMKLGETFTEEDLRLVVVIAQYASMAVAMHRLQATLRRESATKANLMRQFSPKVAERLLTARGRLRLGGERSEVTILNADIRGFTKLAQEMDADEVVQMVNDYFAVMVPIIFASKGTIDKFMGDAILAVFGSPEPDPNHHCNAITAASEMHAAVAKLNEVRRQQGAVCREFGIGIHCGEVVHGFVGTADRMEFTVIGDAVNRASRYCAAAGSAETLISPEVYEHAWKSIDSERISIDTKHEGVFVAYRVKGIKSPQ